MDRVINIVILIGIVLLVYAYRHGWFAVSLFGLLAFLSLITAGSPPTITIIFFLLFVYFLIKKIRSINQGRTSDEIQWYNTPAYVPIMSGVEYEHYVASRLREMGYTNVHVTQGSGDFGADIIATAPNGTVYSIQCKHFTSGKCGVKAVQEAIAGMYYYHCGGCMVITTASFTPAAVEMAKKSGTILWDNFH